MEKTTGQKLIILNHPFYNPNGDYCDIHIRIYIMYTMAEKKHHHNSPNKSKRMGVMPWKTKTWNLSPLS